MGNTIKTHLDEDDNACEVSRYIKSVSGIAANSVSDTDIWLLYFNQGTLYEDSIVKEAIAKISINNNFINKITKNEKIKINPTQRFIDVNSSLEYEMKIYRDVIRPLIDNKISPNFIKYYASGFGCSFDNLLSILKKDKSKKIDEKNLVRNLRFLLGINPEKKKGVSEGRPSITQKVSEKIDEAEIDMFRNRITYNIIINELSTSPTLEEYIYKQKIKLDDIYNILLQASLGCYAMYLSKMVHQDIHISNVFVERIRPTQITYKIFGKYYTFNTNIILKIYDFDNGYAQRLGNNLYNNVDRCRAFLICNKLQNNSDIVRFCISLLGEFTKGNIVRNAVTSIVSKDNLNNKQKDEVSGILRSNYLSSETLIRTDDVLNLFSSTEDIIKKTASKIKDMKIGANPPTNSRNLYKCEPEMFNEDGSLNTIKIDLMDL
jgi:hypothetical protein